MLLERQALVRKGSIFKSKIPLSLKKKFVINAFSLPTITYGAKASNLIKKLTSKLRTAQLESLRKTTEEESESENRMNFKIFLKQPKN